jgi:hypothetical protein
MMKKSRIIMVHGLLDYAQIKGMEKPKPETKPEKLSLLTKLWQSVV